MDSAEFWLSPGVKWCRLNRGNPVYFYAVPWIALGFLLLRTLVEGWILEPLGLAMSIPDQCCSPPQANSQLEKVFRKCRVPSKDTITVLAKEIGWTPYRVQKWFWKSRNHKKPSSLKKFKETAWRFAVYLGLVVYGLLAISKEPYFYDQSLCFQGYPSNPPSDPVLLYWACQLAFYCSLIISQFNDVRRKDFYQMLIHHVVTIFLLGSCYIVNMMQIGVLIALVHDVSDVPLELAKLLHYATYDNLAQVLFGLFAVVFVITRLVVYPFWLIWSVIVDIPKISGMYPALYIFIPFLLVLQLLHLYWFKLIFSMLLQLFRDNELTGDTRSDSELSECTLSSSESIPNGVATQLDKKTA